MVETGHKGLPISQAAAALGVPIGTLRRWLREGCPAVTRGRRGRGQAALVDPDQIRQWRAAGERELVFLQLASAVPHVLAAATVESWRTADGLDKRRLAGVLAGTWYTQTTAVLDHLRDQCPAVPDVESLPDGIEALRKIAR